MIDLSTLIITWGYLGLFIASLISNASLILPVPFFMVAIGAGVFLDPLLVGLVAAVGGAIGELTAYGVAYGSEKLSARYKKTIENWSKKYELWFQTHGGFVIIILFAATPLPFDAVGLLCGFLKYDVKKFLLAAGIGKFVMYSLLAFGGMYGWNVALDIFNMTRV